MSLARSVPFSSDTPHMRVQHACMACNRAYPTREEASACECRQIGDEKAKELISAVEGGEAEIERNA